MKFACFSTVAVALSLSLSVSASSQTSAEEFSPDRFRAHVAFLSDDLLEGREAGTRGHDIAAKYVATQFDVLGLQPMANGSWYQEVPFLHYTLNGTPRITIGGQTFTHGQEVVVQAGTDGQPLDLEAPVVFVGHGIDAPALGLDDYAGLDVRGKVVAVLAGIPDSTPSDIGAHVNSQKASMASARGAVGMIILRSKAQLENMPWANMVRTVRSSELTWEDPEGRPYSESPGLRFTAMLDLPVAEKLFEGAPRSLAEILEAQSAGRSPEGFALPNRIRIEMENSVARFTSPNVVAVLPGSDPALAGEYVLLMAHLDGLGMYGDGREGDIIRNGAMDNATGIATMLEYARQLATSPDRPRRSILFAAVTAEEKGLLGSQYLANNPVVDGPIVGVVNLDMPILTYDFQDVVAFGAEHSTLGPIVARAAERMGVGVSPDPLPQERLFVRSDHYRFVQKGIPAIFLMTGFAGEGQTEFVKFLRGAYHGADDDMNLPIRWEAGARFARLNYLIAREIADADEAPQWYSDSFFGNLFGGDQPKAER